MSGFRAALREGVSKEDTIMQTHRFRNTLLTLAGCLIAGTAGAVSLPERTASPPGLFRNWGSMRSWRASASFTRSSLGAAAVAGFTRS
jgi:hypothetical protein